MENHPRLVKYITSGNRSHSQSGISLSIPPNANVMHKIMIAFGDIWPKGIQVADVVMMRPEVENCVW